MSSPVEHAEPSGRRRRMARADRERQLLEVAEQVLVEQGYVTMDEIARRAGVTKPLLYDHFGSKDGLVVACIARVRAELLQASEEAIAGGGAPRQMFRLGIRAFFEYIGRHERAWAVLLAEGLLTGPAGAEVEALRQQQADFVSRLFAGVTGTPGSAALETYAQAVVGACERVALWRRDRGSPAATDAADHLADMFWSGLGELAVGGRGY